MNTQQRCLQELKLIRSAAENPESAYIVRTRLRRFLNSCSRLVELFDEGSESHGENTVDISNERQEQLRALALRLETKANQLCQPSEALDARWLRGWSSVEQDLSSIEVLLSA